MFKLNKPLTFSLIGGDLRQLYAASLLAADGHKVRIYGFGNSTPSNKSIYIATSVKDCTETADVVILPMPYSISGGNIINSPLTSELINTNEIISSTPQNRQIFAGKVDSFLFELCRNNQLSCIDYSKREELAIMNAIPTAEGALSIALSNTPYTLRDSKCLVIGYGRIGKILSKILQSLGAFVTPTARKYSDLATIYANGFEPIHTNSLEKNISKYDIIFNTVPYKILDFKALSATKNNVLIIDLASIPGGVDFETANKLNRKTIQALSLPGKFAPETAGKIIKDTIINILEESEVQI